MCGIVNLQRKPDKQEKSLLLSHSARPHACAPASSVPPLGWKIGGRGGVWLSGRAIIWVPLQSFPSHRGAVVSGLDLCALHPACRNRKRAGPVRRARRREQAGDISCADSLRHIHNSANKLQERTLFCCRWIRRRQICMSSFFVFFSPKNGVSPHFFFTKLCWTRSRHKG